jgi:hypothetical protein
MSQGTSVIVWLGVGGVALIWGNLQLWHTRRVLKHLRVEIPVQVKRAAPVGSGRT